MYTDEYIDPERQNRQAPLPVCWAAEISNDAFQNGDDVFVTIPGIDGGRSRFGPCRWSPQVADSGSSYPEEGNDALVVRDDIGEYWILKWWVYG